MDHVEGLGCLESLLLVLVFLKLLHNFLKAHREW
jgi:hypothetical protein